MALSTSCELFKHILTHLALTKTYRKGLYYLFLKVRKWRQRKLAQGCSHNGKTRASHHRALNHCAKQPPVGKWWTVRNKYFITSYKNKLLAYIPAFKNIHSPQNGENMELPGIKEKSRGYSMKMSIEEKKVLVSWRPEASPHCTQLRRGPGLACTPILHHLDRERGLDAPRRPPQSRDVVNSVQMSAFWPLHNMPLVWIQKQLNHSSWESNDMLFKKSSEKFPVQNEMSTQRNNGLCYSFHFS